MKIDSNLAMIVFPPDSRLRRRNGGRSDQLLGDFGLWCLATLEHLFHIVLPGMKWNKTTKIWTFMANLFFVSIWLSLYQYTNLPSIYCIWPSSDRERRICGRFDCSNLCMNSHGHGLRYYIPAWIDQIKSMVGCPLHEFYNLVQDRQRWCDVVAVASCQSWQDRTDDRFLHACSQ